MMKRIFLIFFRHRIMLRSLKKQGFTLLEIALVIIVTGMLAGAVFVGQDLFHAAKVKAVINEYETIQKAFVNFEIKYGCIPGDCDHSSDFFGHIYGTPPSDNMDGNGDGKINGVDLAVGFVEPQLAWRQLALAGFIGGDYTGKRASHGVGEQAYIYGGENATDYPTKYEEKAGYRMEYFESYIPNNANVVWLQGQSDVAPWGGANIIRVKDAYYIDSKIDDGKPGLGGVTGHTGGDRKNDWSVGFCNDGNNLETPALRASAVYRTGSDMFCSMRFALD